MNLAILISRLAREVRSYGWTLARASEREPSLVSYDSPRALLAALADRRPDTFAARDALVRAVIAEHRRRPHPLWPSVLTIAFHPMLAGLRGRIATRAPGELDQAVVMAFLESIERVALRTNMAARLRCATHRAIFRALGREQRRLARTLPIASEDQRVLD
ncbi:MAG: hypothetical protein ACRELB_19945, partial [Polyangiaceae bacterium]